MVRVVRRVIVLLLLYALVPSVLHAVPPFSRTFPLHLPFLGMIITPFLSAKINLQEKIVNADADPNWLGAIGRPRVKRTTFTLQHGESWFGVEGQTTGIILGFHGRVFIRDLGTGPGSAFRLERIALYVGYLPLGNFYIGREFSAETLLSEDFSPRFHHIILETTHFGRIFSPYVPRSIQGSPSIVFRSAMLLRHVRFYASAQQKISLSPSPLFVNTAWLPLQTSRKFVPSSSPVETNTIYSLAASFRFAIRPFFVRVGTAFTRATISPQKMMALSYYPLRSSSVYLRIRLQNLVFYGLFFDRRNSINPKNATYRLSHTSLHVHYKGDAGRGWLGKLRYGFGKAAIELHFFQEVSTPLHILHLSGEDPKVKQYPPLASNRGTTYGLSLSYAFLPKVVVYTSLAFSTVYPSNIPPSSGTTVRNKRIHDRRYLFGLTIGT